MKNIIHTTDGLNWQVSDSTVAAIVGQTGGSEWYLIPAPGFDIGLQGQPATYGRYYHARQIAFIEINRNDT